MLPMRQVSYVISTYTSDISGVCSALYELGGMVVIHDPSGCNSTYNTHDEPRWFDQDSAIFISGLSQMDAVMGSDDKFVQDIIRAAEELQPAFIALVRSPIPLMIGTDFEGIAREVETATGIPTFFVPTTGMKSYIQGAGMALESVVRYLMPEKGISDQENDRGEAAGGNRPLRVNLLGVTPLDFSVNASYDKLISYLQERGFSFQGSLALKTDYEQMSAMPQADVNLVVTSCGYPAARAMKERYGIPYVVGLPCGVLADRIAEDLTRAADSGRDIISYRHAEHGCRQSGLSPSDKSPGGSSSICDNDIFSQERPGMLIHEPVIAQCLALAYGAREKRELLAVTMLDTAEELCGEGLIRVDSEEEMQKILCQAGRIYADPMFRPICREEIPFIPLPHEAFSGRIYRREMPLLLW